MDIAFFTEIPFVGKIPHNHPNMRTEFAWMVALDADQSSSYARRTSLVFSRLYSR